MIYLFLVLVSSAFTDPPIPAVPSAGGNYQKAVSPSLTKSEKKKKKDEAPMKAGFLTTTTSCYAYKSPKAGAESISEVGDKKRLWTEPASKNYVKVYTKKGAAFMPIRCFR